MLVKIFVNPTLLEHGIVLQRAGWLAEEEEVLRKVSFTFIPWIERNVLAKVYF